MSNKITNKNIRKQLEKLHQQNDKAESIKPKKSTKKYKGLGLNWRGSVIFILLLIHVSLYQFNA